MEGGPIMWRRRGSTWNAVVGSQNLLISPLTFSPLHHDQNGDNKVVDEEEPEDNAEHDDNEEPEDNKGVDNSVVCHAQNYVLTLQ